ncbi:MAG: hypothetical protein EKK40_07020 [Bradyrhizobiaceae bacterium]|nr:MAG: hypothetical protein EKK40_07020 [Bradyrhizobiaceae bacterium]
MFTGSLGEFSNREDWEMIFDVVDDDTGDMIDLSDASIVFQANRKHDGNSPILATTDNGAITLVDTGAFRIFISRDQVTNLEQGQYEAGISITNAGQTIQEFTGALDVQKGNVPK